MAMSPLSQGRELKSEPCALPTELLVAPLAGARIEIAAALDAGLHIVVAPLAGARIEITAATPGRRKIRVAPLAGARIEILFASSF